MKKGVPTLSQLLKIHKKEGVRAAGSMPFRGEVEVVLRDIPTGKIVRRVKKRNMSTRWMGDFWNELDWQNPGHIFLSNDTKDMHSRKGMMRNTFRDASSVAAAYSYNLTNKTWTFTGTISAPTAGYTRVFQNIGISLYDEYTFTGYSRMIFNVLAATKLTSAITQTDTQQVEVSYRFTFQRV